MNLDHVRWFARSDLLGSRPARSRNVGLGLYYFSRLWPTESEIREFQVEPLDKMEDVKAFQCDQAVRELLNEGFEK
jgi:hypothetical protein